MTYVKIEKTEETLKSLKIRWANMLKNLLNQENNSLAILRIASSFMSQVYFLRGFNFCIEVLNISLCW